jgi:stress-induced morphogen
MSRVAQHRAVMDVLDAELKDRVHAGRTSCRAESSPAYPR